MLLQLVPLLFRDQMKQFLDTANGPQLLLIVLAALVVLDGAVLLAAVARFQRQLRAMGVVDALEERGVEPGDLVRIGERELEWQP